MVGDRKNQGSAELKVSALQVSNANTGKNRNDLGVSNKGTLSEQEPFSKEAVPVT